MKHSRFLALLPPVLRISTAILFAVVLWPYAETLQHALRTLTRHTMAEHNHHHGHTLHAQNVYTKLRDPEQIAVFNEVSDGLICLCGSNMVLSSCPHVESPWGIPIRRFVEDRIQAGIPAETILAKMETGFGDSVRQVPVVRVLEQQGRTDLVNGFVSGFGQKVSARGGTTLIIVISLAFTIGALALVRFWYQRKRRPNPGAKTAKDNEPTDLSKRFQNLDQ